VRLASFITTPIMPHPFRAGRTFSDDESGATMVEYGIMVALIAAISIVVITTLGTRVQSAFQAVVTALT
jgi:pilus assembly protein Flp/PilA